MRGRAALLLVALAAGCGGGGEGDAANAAALEARLRALPTPAEHAAGADLYRACAPCHGELALGTQSGPPLVHPVYEPSHHADAAFLLAVRQGVRAHHWGFGDMPPVPGLSTADVERIVGYVRWLQRQAGIG